MFDVFFTTWWFDYKTSYDRELAVSGIRCKRVKRKGGMLTVQVYPCDNHSPSLFNPFLSKLEDSSNSGSKLSRGWRKSV